MNESNFTYKLACNMSKLFNMKKDSIYKLFKYIVYYGLHDMLGRTLDSDSKVYESEIVIPMIGILKVTRDKDNNIVSSSIELTDEYKESIIKTMDGESLLTDMMDEEVVKDILRRYNNIL